MRTPLAGRVAGDGSARPASAGGAASARRITASDEARIRNAAIAARVRVRLDDVRRVDASHADVTYTLLLDDAAVLDHLPGAAVLSGGRWLVTRRTYCDVSTQGASEIPPPCR